MKNFVVIAHNKLKPNLVDFLMDKSEWLKVRNSRLVATGRTAEVIEKAGIEDVKHLSPGKSGGYNQITNMIANDEIDIVIFFRDHEIKEPHHEDIQLLLDTCDKCNIPLATNRESAELLILGLIKKEAYERSKKIP